MMHWLQIVLRKANHTPMIQMIAAEILFEMVSMFNGMEGPIFDNDE